MSADSEQLLLEWVGNNELLQPVKQDTKVLDLLILIGGGDDDVIEVDEREKMVFAIGKRIYRENTLLRLPEAFLEENSSRACEGGFLIRKGRGKP